MKMLLLGSTGLLGQAVATEARIGGLDLLEAARSGAGVTAVDISAEAQLSALLVDTSPDVVFNCAALTDIEQCEDDPGRAFAINARPLATLAAWSHSTDRVLVHVSTDHFFTEGGRRAHREDDPITLCNEYARSKFAGEDFALAADKALVLRTSIVGMRGWPKPTFAEWAIQSILGRRPMTLFEDAYTSTIDVRAFARAALDLVKKQAAGLLNLGASEVYTKAEFIRELARKLGRSLESSTTGSVADLKPKRAPSVGLDVSRAEQLLGYQLPRMEQVAEAVVRQFRERERA